MKKAIIVMVVLAILISTAQAKRIDTVEGVVGDMTAGGALDANGVKVAHTLELDCDGFGQSKLNVNWESYQFQLESIAIVCPYGSNQVYGWGNGILNGEPGATIVFSFTDNGEPGSGDYGEIDINDAYKVNVLKVSNYLESGNYQWHT